MISLQVFLTQCLRADVFSFDALVFTLRISKVCAKMMHPGAQECEEMFRSDVRMAT